MKTIIKVIIILVLSSSILYAQRSARKIPQKIPVEKTRITKPDISSHYNQNERVDGGINNSSAKIVIDSGTYVVISGGNYQSQGTSGITDEGTLMLTGNFVNSNSSGNPASTTGTVVFFNGSSQQQINGNSTNFGNVTLDNSSGLVVNCSASVAGDLTLISGDLNMNGQTITLGPSANLIESGGVLYGTSGTIQTTRSLSGIAEDVAGLGAEITEDGDLGSTTIVRGHTPQGSNAIERYYQITTANSPTNATLVFHYLDSELNGVAEGDLKLFKSSDGDDWTVQGSSSVNTNDNTIALTGINSFSWWTAGDGDAPLPVNLSSFYALYTSGTPTLYWTTQTEENNAYWNIYRATTDNFENAVNINANDPVPGNGTTNMANDYIYVDTVPVVQNSTYWYWIEDVSTDGETTLHDPITLTIPFEDTPITPESYGLQQNYPNPFNPSTSISFALAEDSDVDLVIYNIKGEKVKTIFSDHVYSDRITSVVWEGDDESGKQVSSGVYFYKLKTGTKEFNKKMLMVK